MKFVAGDITEVSCNHPTLGDFRFYPKANESFTLDPGGIRNADDANNVTGDGSMIQVKNRVLWSFEGPIAVDLLGGKEIEDIPKLMASSEEGVWTVTHISGAIWRGSGVPVGDFNADTNSANSTLKAAGGGIMEKI
jgi:hypothetical protein